MSFSLPMNFLCFYYYIAQMNFQTCLILTSPVRSWAVLFVYHHAFHLHTINSNSILFRFFSTVLSHTLFNVPSEPAIHSVLEYVVRLHWLIINPSNSFCIILHYRLNELRKHPCHTPFSVSIYPLC